MSLVSPLLGILCLLLAPTAHAQTSSPTSGSTLEIEAQLGFSGTFRLGRWTPLTVTVTNRGNDLTANLQVEVTGGSEFQGTLYNTVHRRRLELPRDARKRFRFTIFLESFTRPLTVRVVSGGRDLARQSIDLRQRFATGRPILVLSRDADLDYLNDAQEDGLRVLYPHPELLPDHWRGYDGAQALVIHGVSLERLTARQYAAIEKWIAHGGIVAVSGGPDRTVLRTERLAELLPGKPDGRVRFDNGVEVSRVLLRTIDAPVLDAREAFTVDRLMRFRGEVLYGVENVPLAIRERRGRGAVLYLTFDVARYPFAGWSGMRALWMHSLRLPPPQALSLSVARSEPDSAVRELVASRPDGFPGRGTVFVFLALYLTMLATVYRLRPRKAASATSRLIARAWPSLALPVLFAPAAYLLFGPAMFPKGATALVLSIVEPLSPGSYARLRVDVGMYSNHDGRLDFEYAGAEPLFRPTEVAHRQTEAPDWTMTAGTAHSASADDSRKFVLHTLEGRDVIPYPMQASAARTLASDGTPEIRLRLANDTGAPLQRAWLVDGKWVYPLGAIEGREFDRILSAKAKPFHLDEATWATILGAGERATAAIVERTLSEAGPSGGDGHGNTLLIGLSQSPLRLAGDSATWRHDDLTLVLLRVPLAPGPASPDESEEEDSGDEPA